MNATVHRHAPGRPLPLGCLIATLLLVPAPARARQGPTQPAPEWSRTPDRLPRDLIALPDDILIGLTANSVDGYDAASGTMLWRLPDQTGQVEAAIADPARGYVAIMRTTNEGVGSFQVDVVDHRAGQGVWSTGRKAGRLQQWQVSGKVGRIVVLSRGGDGRGMLEAWGAGDGRPAWQHQVGLTDRQRPTGTRSIVLLEDQVVRIEEVEGAPAVYAHDIDSGRVRWVAYLQEQRAPIGLSIAGGDVLVAGTRTTCLETGAGATRWELRDPWVPVEVRGGWILARSTDGDRLQMIAARDGDTRWRGSGAEVPGPAPHAVAWTIDGILVGSGGGASVLYNETNASRITRDRARYEPGERKMSELAIALTDGVLFAYSGPEGTEVVRTTSRGRTQWTNRSASPAMVFSTAEIAARRLFAGPGSAGAQGRFWVVVRGGQARDLLGLRMNDGAQVAAIQILQTAPVMVVDPARRRLVYLNREGSLTSVRY